MSEPTVAERFGRRRGHELGKGQVDEMKSNGLIKRHRLIRGQVDEMKSNELIRGGVEKRIS